MSKIFGIKIDHIVEILINCNNDKTKWSLAVTSIGGNTEWIYFETREEAEAKAHRIMNESGNWWRYEEN